MPHIIHTKTTQVEVKLIEYSRSADVYVKSTMMYDKYGSSGSVYGGVYGGGVSSVSGGMGDVGGVDFDQMFDAMSMEIAQILQKVCGHYVCMLCVCVCGYLLIEHTHLALEATCFLSPLFPRHLRVCECACL